MVSFNRKLSFQLVLIVLVLSSILFVIPNIPKSYAHAYIDHSDPASSQSLNTAPSKIDIYFNDAIDIKYSQVRILDLNGKEVQGQNLHYITNDQKGISISVEPGLPNGIYTVLAKVLDQTDGHVTSNTFFFGVGQTVPQNVTSSQGLNNYEVVSLPEAIARFPAILGQVMVTGAVSATLWLWSPISRISRLKDSTLEARTKIDSAMVRWITIGSNILLVSGVAMITVQAYSINAGILDAISTKFGNTWILRMVLSSALFALSFVMYHKMKSSPKVLSKKYLLTLFGLSFAVLATTSLISHGAATGQIIPLLIDFFHNVFASLWIGGVIYIALVVMPYLKQITNSNLGLSVISILIPRFSTLVITVLGAVVITGPFLLYVLEGNLALTLASFYGKILIIKLSLAAVMISFGAYNQTAIYKSVYTAISDNPQKNTTLSETVSINASRILNKFHSSIKIEALIGIALIASVAVLVDSGLPSSEFQNILQSLPDKVFALAANSNSVNIQQFSQTRFIENGSRIVLSISPFSTGNNNFNISFLDSNKNPIDIKSVQLKLTQTDSGIGAITIDTNQTSVGTFSTDTYFGFAGHWTVRVEGIQNKENALNLVASYDLLVKPQLGNLVTNITEFKTPGNSTPRYPVYDSTRNKIWVGDIMINSGKILEFDLGSDKYTEHKIAGLNSVIYMALDSHDTLWYIDYQRKILGHYSPDDNSNQDYPIPSQGILSSIAIDNNDTIWITSASTNEVLKFNIKTTKFDSIKLANYSDPLGMAIDNTSGKIWIAEGSGKIVSLDTSNNKIEEYAPTAKNYTLLGPTGIILDPQTGKIYVSEHEGRAVSVFDPLLKTFKRIQLDPDPDDLPFGMAFDKYHNLWVALHTLDKIAILDTRTGEYIEKNIPSPNSSVQWITPDSQGNIVIAEERANALGTITISVNPTSGNLQSNQANIPVGIPKLGFSYVQVVAPSVTGLLIVVAFFYCKSVIDLKKSLRQVRKTQEL
ncbi:MAG: hypothetical protein E6K98_01250 [Thaumarchaeota archaeon]|nr:MAG: hypothetical protein E6K98_01250 [Nitrososphaerota archaeon]